MHPTDKKLTISSPISRSWINEAEQRHNRITIAVLCGFFMLLAFLYENCWRITYFQVPLFGRKSPWVAIGSTLCVIALFVSLAFRWQRLRSLGSFSICLLWGFFITISIPFLINGIFVYNQPPIGLFRTWFWFSGLLLLIVFHLWDNSCVLYRYLFKTILLLGVLVSILAIVVVLLPPIQGIFDPQVIKERYGLVRLGRLSNNCVILALFFFLVRLLRFEKGNKNHILIVVGLALSTANIFLIQLGRQRIFGVIVTTLYFLLRYKKRLEPGKTWLLVAGIGLLFTFSAFSSSLIQQGLTSIFSDEVDESAFRSAQKRVEGVEFYFQEFKKSGWIGFGKISTAYNTQGNPIVEAIEEDKTFLIDLGFIGSFFQYGIPSAIFLVAVLYMWFKDLSFVIREGGEDLTDIALTIELFLISRIAVFSSFFYAHFNAYFYVAIMYIILSTKKQASWRKYGLSWDR